jgi:hypothetical protein
MCRDPVRAVRENVRGPGLLNISGIELGHLEGRSRDPVPFA